MKTVEQLDDEEDFDEFLRFKLKEVKAKALEALEKKIPELSAEELISVINIEDYIEVPEEDE